MKKVLKLEKLIVLSSSEQKEISGGAPKDWFKCCLNENSFGNPPLGCESWVICDGFY